MDVLSMCLMPISVIQPPSDLSLFTSPLCSHLTETIFENDSEVGWDYGSLKGVCWLTCAFCVQFDFVVFSRLFLLVDVSRICFSSISVYFVVLIWFSWSLNSPVLNAKNVTVGSLWFLRKHPFWVDDQSGACTTANAPLSGNGRGFPPPAPICSLCRRISSPNQVLQRVTGRDPELNQSFRCLICCQSNILAR